MHGETDEIEKLVCLSHKQRQGFLLLIMCRQAFMEDVTDVSPLQKPDKKSESATCIAGLSFRLFGRKLTFQIQSSKTLKQLVTGEGDSK